MSGPFFDDPELADLFAEDPSLRDVSARVRAARVTAEPDPRFRNQLRAELMEAARTELGRSPWWSRAAGRLALGGAGLGVALAATAAVLVVTDRRGTTVETPSVVACSVCGNSAVPLDDVITVAFSVPMDHASVEAALHITPAISHSVQWNGTQLVIHPKHRLASNTSYTVTIDHAVAHDSAGAALPSDIHLTFGTVATPAPTVQPTPTAVPGPPSLSTVAAGPVATGTPLLFGPDGTLYGFGTSSGPVPGAAPTPSPTASSAPTGVTSASGSPSPSPSPSPTAGGSGGVGSGAALERLTGGSATQLVAPASAAAISPDGSSIAAEQPDPAGGFDVVVTGIDGSNPHQVAIAHGGLASIAWTTDGVIRFVDGGRLAAVDTSGRHRTTPGFTVQSGQVVVWSPDGHWAYAGWPNRPGAADGTLVSLGDGHTHGLNGSRSEVGFSGDGSTVAWADFSNPAKTMLDQSAPGSPSWLYVDTGPIGDVAVDQNGGRIAYVRGGTGLRVDNADGSRILAEYSGGDALANPVWSSQGSRIAFTDTATSTASVATVPGASFSSEPSLAPGAASTLQRFTQAQLAGGNPGVLQQLAPSLDPTTLVPPAQGVTRSFTVTFQQSGGTVTAQVRLVVDATQAQPVAQYADETVTLQQGASGWTVSGVQIGAFQDVPAGPQITGITTASSNGTTVIDVTFDSDLDPSTVVQAVTVRAHGAALDATVEYDQDSRTIVVTVATPQARSVEVSVSTGLHDVDGTPLAKAFRGTVAL